MSEYKDELMKTLDSTWAKGLNDGQLMLIQRVEDQVTADMSAQDIITIMRGSVIKPKSCNDQ